MLRSNVIVDASPKLAILRCCDQRSYEPLDNFIPIVGHQLMDSIQTIQHLQEVHPKQLDILDCHRPWRAIEELAKIPAVSVFEQ